MGFGFRIDEEYRYLVAVIFDPPCSDSAVDQGGSISDDIPANRFELIPMFDFLEGQSMEEVFCAGVRDESGCIGEESLTSCFLLNEVFDDLHEIVELRFLHSVIRIRGSAGRVRPVPETAFHPLYGRSSCRRPQLQKFLQIP